MHGRYTLFVLYIALILSIALAPPVALSKDSVKRCAVLVELDMQIDGGAALFIERSIGYAKSKGCVLVIEIDSYGGYVSAADRIVKGILNSGIECYSWIPPGGKAASAAAMIALACKRIFMGSGSTIGAAKPIPSDEKTVEYVASRFRALAQKMFGSNSTLVSVAEDMVRKSRSLSYREAIELGFAEPAESIDDVLTKINGYLVEELSPSYWEKLVSIISNPVIASIMLSIGALLILLEVLVTGFQGYAIAGALLIAFALYGMSIIPPDMLTLALLLSGAILLVVEIYTPGFGAFGIAGISLLAIGIYMLFTSQPPGTVNALTTAITGSLIAFGGLVAFIAYKAAKVIKMKRPRIEETLIGAIGIAKTDVGETQSGVVYVANEEWTAYSVSGRIEAGSKVRVVRVEGLKLYVERVEEQ